MLFYSVLVINKEFYSAEVFSEVLPNLSKQKLDITKLSKLNKHLQQLWHIGIDFSKKDIFCSNKKK